MKFRLKVGPYFGALNPNGAGSQGRSFGMMMVPWIKLARDHLGTSLKNTKELADHLRAAIDSEGQFKTVVVDDTSFPFLARVHLPMIKNEIIEFVDFVDVRTGYEPLVITDGRPVEIIKAAMRDLIEINAWNDVRRLAEVLMDIEDEQPV